MMRRLLALVAVGGALGAASSLAVPAHAVTGREAAVAYEVNYNGDKVAEEPGDVRVFSECGGLFGTAFCDVSAVVPPQEAGVFAGDTSVQVSVTTYDAEY